MTHQALVERLRYCADSPCVDEPALRDLLREAAAALTAAGQEGAAQCEGTCNPFIASCGATFCTYEEMAAHNRQHGEGAAQEPPPQSELLAELERAAWSRSRRRVKAAWDALAAHGFTRPPVFPAPQEPAKAQERDR